MKSTTLIIGIVISLIIGGGIGYASGKGTNNNSAQPKELEDSVTMMKEQSAAIQKMAEMMKTGGALMQELGMKYKNDEATVEGKDLEMFGEKYLKDTTTTSGSSDSMKQMMGN